MPQIIAHLFVRVKSRFTAVNLPRVTKLVSEERSSRRRPVWNAVRRSLERDAVLAVAGARLAAAVEAFQADGDRERLAAALEAYREARAQARAQAPGPT